MKTLILITFLAPIFGNQIISDDYLKILTPKSNSNRYSRLISQSNNGAKSEPLQSSTSYHHPISAPIKEYHHTAHEHHEHHEIIRDGVPYQSYDHAPHSPDAHHYGVPILGHMFGHVPYADSSAHAPSISDIYRVQDTYGNYGFGYETRTIDGDANYRHEKKNGALTEGSYGYKTDTAVAHNEFAHVPYHHSDHPPLYDNAHSGYSIPIPDIPPAASAHPQYHPHVQENYQHSNHAPENYQHSNHAPVNHPVAHNSMLDYSPTPIFHSLYDMEIPYALYSHLLRDVLNSDESSHKIILPQEPVEPSAEEIIGSGSLTEAIEGIFGNPNLHEYMSYLDRVVPSGIHSRLSTPPVYRDRKKKR